MAQLITTIIIILAIIKGDTGSSSRTLCHLKSGTGTPFLDLLVHELHGSMENAPN